MSAGGRLVLGDERVLHVHHPRALQHPERPAPADVRARRRTAHPGVIYIYIYIYTHTYTYMHIYGLPMQVVAGIKGEVYGQDRFGARSRR